jgi:hypothetical protein
MQALVLDKTRKLDRARDNDNPTEQSPGCDQAETVVGVVTNLSEEVFAIIWNNPKDADYDDL